MAEKDPYDPEDDSAHRYECMECGHRVESDSPPGTCPECGGEMQNLSRPREK